MNRNGFTLVEMLATIVILSIVLGIASYGVISAINSSKDKSEEVFVQKLGTLLDSYIATNVSTFSASSDCSTFTKTGSIGSRDVGICKVGGFYLKKIVDDGYVDKSQFVNPKTKESCYDSSKQVDVYRDGDYVYYYSVDLKDVCGLGEEYSPFTSAPVLIEEAEEAN